MRVWAPSPTPTSGRSTSGSSASSRSSPAGALREADAIAATDGVDVLFVGPADLSHSLGVPGQFGSKTYLAALEAVVDACRAHGKSPGILVYDTAVVPGLLELGFRFVGIGADGALVSAGAHAAWRPFRAEPGAAARARFGHSSRHDATPPRQTLPSVHGSAPLGRPTGRDSGRSQAGK